jgi:CheY-like chemotaxis protein
MIFKDEGAEVIEAPDANQAMRLLKTERPDLMTLDLIMPHKTGEKLYWELRKDPEFAGLPIVIVTGYARAETPAINFHKFIAEKLLPEPDGFLEKPIQPEAVLDTVVKILTKKTVN